MPVTQVADVTITELEEIDPTRVDGVGKAANGFKFLMLKARPDGEVDESETTLGDVLKDDGDDDNKKDCGTCDGSGKILEGHRKCPDCQGSGVKPNVGETAKQFAERVAKLQGSAPSGSGATPATNCPTCSGSGKLPNATGDASQAAGLKDCVDCGGTGKDQATVNDQELNAVPGDPGSITEGDAKGREAIDKSKTDPEGYRPTPYHADPDEPVVCPKCLKHNDTDAAYCDQCGHELAGDPDVQVDAAKATSDINDLPDSAFAYIEPGGKKDADGKTTPRSLRHFPVHDAAHARNALSRAPQSPFGDKAMPKIKAAAKKFGVEVGKADGAILTGANPNLADVVGGDGTTALDAAAAQATCPCCGETVADCSCPDGSDCCSCNATGSAGDPGSPDWEAIDCQLATNAAAALMAASDLIRQFAAREAQEAAAGQGNDIFDAWAATDALCSVTDALGIMAQLAFLEGVAAQKASGDDLSKEGKRLSGKTVDALSAARDKLTDLLGDADPANKQDDDDDDDDGDDDSDDDGKSGAAAFIAQANKARLEKEIEDMSIDELGKVLDEREQRFVDTIVAAIGTAVKGAADDEQDSIASAKDAHNQSKKKSPKDDNTDLEDEADQGDNASASGTNQATGAAKADGDDDHEDNEDGATDDASKSDADEDLTPEQIEAKKAAKAAKKAAKAARKAEEEADRQAAIEKAIKDATAEAEKAAKALEDRLEALKATPVPGGPVRARTPDAVAKAQQRDELELRIAHYENVASTTTDPDVRKGAREALAEMRKQLADAGA